MRINSYLTVHLIVVKTKIRGKEKRRMFWLNLSAR